MTIAGLDAIDHSLVERPDCSPGISTRRLRFGALSMRQTYDRLRRLERWGFVEREPVRLAGVLWRLSEDGNQYLMDWHRARHRASAPTEAAQ